VCVVCARAWIPATGERQAGEEEDERVRGRRGATPAPVRVGALPPPGSTAGMAAPRPPPLHVPPPPSDGQIAWLSNEGGRPGVGRGRRPHTRGGRASSSRARQFEGTRAGNDLRRTRGRFVLWCAAARAPSLPQHPPPTHTHSPTLVQGQGDFGTVGGAPVEGCQGKEGGEGVRRPNACVTGSAC
jgi:hypothetical protein